MAIINIETLKTKFEGGDNPRSADYINLIDTLAALPEVGDAENGVAPGGSTGQVLVKVDATDYNTQWSTIDVSAKQDIVANVSSTEIGYLDGVTSAIQTQIDTKASISSPTFTGTVSGITKTHVGLSNVDNTSDANKPISAATQTALDDKLASATASTTYETIANVALKAPLASPTLTGTTTVNNLTVQKYEYLTPIDGADTPAWREGNVYYDNEEKTIILQGSGATFEIAVGQREWVRCRNSSGSSIPKGTPVYVTGVHIPGDPTHGHHPTIAPADASNLSKINVIGITGESISNGAHGYVVVRGYIENLDTSSLTTGDRVHLGVETPGTIIDIAPDYPNYPIDLGICLTSHATAGTIYVDLAQHTFEGMRVTNNAYFDGNVTIQGNISLLGSASEISATNLTVANNFIYLNSGDTIGSSGTTFTGTGINDAEFMGHYNGLTTKTFKVKITINGSGSNPDSFRWSTDNFTTNNGTDIQIIAGTPIVLSDNISIQFIADNGHIVDDVWSGTAAPINLDLALIGNRNTGTSGVGYTHTGLFFDVSDQKFKVFSEYDPEPETNIDTADASFTLGIFKAGSFEGDLLGNVTGSITGNAETVTNGVYSSGSYSDPSWLTISKSKVGLSNVDNTSDASKPVSTATQTALDLKLASATAATTYETISNVALKAPLASPTFTGTVSGVTKTMVGLENVDNTSDASKPVSTATQTALDLKLSSATAATTYQPLVANVSDTEIGYLDGVTSAIQTQIDTKAPLASPTFTGTVTIPSGASISGFAPLASPALTGTPTAPTAISSTNTTQVATTEYVKSVVSDLTNGAGAAYDTLKELQDLIVADESAASTLTTLVGTKAPIASPTFTGTVTIPTGALITSPTISGTGTIAGTFTGNLTGNVTGNVSGNAGTVTNGIYTTTTSLPNVTSVNSTTIPASKTLLVSTDIGSTVQAYDADLTSIASLTATGLLKNTAGTWSIDTTSYSPLAGSSSITTVGTVTAGTFPAANLSGTTLASGVTGSSLTSVGTITAGTWSGSFGAVSGANLTSLTAANISSGTLGSGVVASAGTTTSATSGIGYMGMPQTLNPTSPYTLLATDAGKHIYMTTTGRTITIPANATTALPIGTTFVVINATGVTTTISITTDTLILAGLGSTGSRSLAPFGMATAVKVAATTWVISGNGLS